MTDMKRIIKDWESILSRDPLDVPWDLIDETLTLLKEQEEKEQLEKREKHPCEICQEFTCDGCPYSDSRGD